MVMSELKIETTQTSLYYKVKKTKNLLQLGNFKLPVYKMIISLIINIRESTDTHMSIPSQLEIETFCNLKDVKKKSLQFKKCERNLR